MAPQGTEQPLVEMKASDVEGATREPKPESPTESASSEAQAGVGLLRQTSQLEERAAEKDHYHEKKHGLVAAIAFNTLNMIGTGPLITAPFLINSTGSSTSLIGYACAIVFCLSDSFVWGELGALMPNSGGPYIYLRNCYGRDKWGSLMSFIYLWVFLISSPLELASAFKAAAEYLSFVWPWLNESDWGTSLFGSIFALVCTFALQQDVSRVGQIALFLAAMTLAIVAFVLVSGFATYDADYLKPPSDAYDDKPEFLWNLGTAMTIGLYDLTGYYDVNFMADEIQNPERNVPIAAVGTCGVVGSISVLVILAMLGTISPEEMNQLVEDESDEANYIAAYFVEDIFGKAAGGVMAVMVALMIFSSAYAMMIGVAHVPYAAARDGYFFSIFGSEHPTKKGLPDKSLWIVGILTAILCWIDLGTLIEAFATLITPTQFMAQSIGVWLLRSDEHFGKQSIDARIPLFPLPNIIALIGFGFVFITSQNYLVSGDIPILELSVLVLIVGVIIYLAGFARIHKLWPYNEAAAPQV